MNDGRLLGIARDGSIACDAFLCALVNQQGRICLT